MLRVRGVSGLETVVGLCFLSLGAYIGVNYLVLGEGVDIQFLGLGAGLRVGLRVGVGADGIMNLFSSCCLDIFS